jgi:hypothetical protein
MKNVTSRQWTPVNVEHLERGFRIAATEIKPRMKHSWRQKHCCHLGGAVVSVFATGLKDSRIQTRPR